MLRTCSSSLTLVQPCKSTPLDSRRFKSCNFEEVQLQRESPCCTTFGADFHGSSAGFCHGTMVPHIRDDTSIMHIPSHPLVRDPSASRVRRHESSGRCANSWTNWSGLRQIQTGTSAFHETQWMIMITNHSKIIYSPCTSCTVCSMWGNVTPLRSVLLGLACSSVACILLERVPGICSTESTHSKGLPAPNKPGSPAVLCDKL